MERHRCKLCFKSFSNGRALGGHMRSHLLNLPIPVQLSEETESASSPYSSSSDGEEEDVEDDQDQDQEGEEKGSGGFNYGLRENPKRSIRLVDPEFSVASVVLQDRESETESSKNLTRRRSKRTRKFLLDQTQHDHLQFHQSQEQEEINLVKKIKSFKAAESEPASSISDATTEEEVAFCLMMLSRDKWKIKEEIKVLLQDEEEEEEEEEYEETEKSVEETGESGEINNKSNYKIINNVNRSRGGKYRCETCNRIFKSYQALGGHRASHKKLKIQTSISKEKTKLEAEHNNNAGAEKKIHQCPYCFRVFSSGQALGGHKRSHLIGVAPVPVAAAAAAAVAVAMSSYSTKLGAGENLNSNSSIDLNLPPPIDDDLSQIELSAVADAEFVNYIKR